MNDRERPRPYIAPSRVLPEITPRAVILGVLLSALLAGANAYLGLFAGLTVSASIPAAVISMGLLRALGRTNVLENNIVQTAASAGESLAAGVIFTLPALVMMKRWASFDYLQTTLIALFGGLLGVLFTVPLRTALIVEGELKFPEGVATAEVLKAGDGDGAKARGGARTIAAAGAVGALFKLGEAGLKLWSGSFEWARHAGGTILYFGSNLSPALVAVGFIVGLNVSVLMFLGGALNWLVAIPIVAKLQSLASVSGAPAGSAVEVAGTIWSTQTRYLGVGAMVVGGLWALVQLRQSLASGIHSSIAAYRTMRHGGAADRPRTERDIPFQWIAALLVASVVPLFLVFQTITHRPLVSGVMAVVMLVAGFLFAAVAGYMAGLVGSSNNPISGVTIATILLSSLLLLAMLGRGSPVGPAAAILIGGVVCCAAAIAGDNMQDLKAGHLLGATPIKQQIMQSVGVVAAALVIAPILNLLLHAYGMGQPTADKPDALAAPQAALMASVAEGVFRGGLPWTMVAIGMALAVVIIAIDVVLERRNSSFRTPVLAVAVGIYLPLELSVPILIGGLVAAIAARKPQVHAKPSTVAEQPPRTASEQPPASEAGAGLLFSAGLITGEALVGIVLAIPIVISGKKDALAIFGTHTSPLPGIALLAAVTLLLSRVARPRPAPVP